MNEKIKTAGVTRPFSFFVVVFPFLSLAILALSLIVILAHPYCHPRLVRGSGMVWDDVCLVAPNPRTRRG